MNFPKARKLSFYRNVYKEVKRDYFAESKLEEESLKQEMFKVIYPIIFRQFIMFGFPFDVKKFR